MRRGLILDKYFRSISWYLIKKAAEFSASDHQGIALLFDLVEYAEQRIALNR
jgi:hypothetical protein